ncbi:hypothetical protein [Treponema pedis]|uniref:Uncharacterized protein n=2 Tax=Treponema pedis TaxID=409322 RepID=S6A7T5_9SPIR|nr:hypothetical protein [Treponema pedis]AGT42649.1 hypothetical protein TPE_0153 [Treponema pedis str. T A4]QOW61667.1 hypothetical protein IFE08_04635 [Treponema pedis]QSI03540.1 hypothetical protein DYQ05_00725 [Treponema pedis]
MKLYAIKSAQGDFSYCTILQESESGYMIRICMDKAGYQKISENFIDKELFNLCVRTGYIKELAEEASVVA